MCEHGDTVLIETPGGNLTIDRCIAALVGALNDGGLATVRSCCGHGRWPGWVHLEDGRMLIVYDRGMVTKPTCATTHMDVAAALGYRDKGPRMRHRGGIVKGPQWHMLRPHDGFQISAELTAKLDREAERHAGAVVTILTGGGDMAEELEIYQDEFESEKVDAVAEGVGTWKRKPAVVRARFLKRPVVLHVGAGALFGAAGWWLVEEDDVLTIMTAEVFDATYEYDGPAGAAETG